MLSNTLVSAIRLGSLLQRGLSRVAKIPWFRGTLSWFEIGFVFIDAETATELLFKPLLKSSEHVQFSGSNIVNLMVKVIYYSFLLLPRSFVNITPHTVHERALVQLPLDAGACPALIMTMQLCLCRLCCA